jgi:hypothetical protein
MTQPPTGSPDPYQHDPYQHDPSRDGAPPVPQPAPQHDPFAPPSGGQQAAPAPEQPSTWGTPAGDPAHAPQGAQPYETQQPYAGQQPYGTQQPYGAQPYGTQDPSQQYGGYPAYGAPAPSTTNALAITGFVLAVLGLLGCWIPGVNFFAVVLGVAGLVLGIVGLLQVKKGKSGKGLALSAIVVGALAIVGSIIAWVVLAQWIDSVSTDYEESLAQLEEDLGDTSAVLPEDEPAPTEQPPAEEDLATEVPSGTAPFGETIVYEDGLEVSVAAPAAFAPSEWSAGGEGYPAHVRFDVTITNGTDAPFDPSMVFLTASSAGTEADQVFDSEGGLDGGPMTTVLPGQSVTFAAGFGVTDPADLLVQVAPGPFEYDDALFSTTP